MGLVLLISVGLGWSTRRAIVQRHAVRNIVAAKGHVRYDFERTSFPLRQPKISGPRWLVDFLGIDFFAKVTEVSFRTAPGILSSMPSRSRIPS